MVGDPNGKRAERPVLPIEQIDANAAAIRAQLGRFLRFPAAGEPGQTSRTNDARMRNNADWLRPLGLMEFLRDTGKHFTVSYMLQKEAVKSRMEAGISYTEFSYMLVQAYDYWHLFTAEGCELQMGGSDQWGNITAGIELVSRRESREVYGLVFPLITTSSGAKFGKSEGDNIWLDPARTSPYKFYQFWLNTDDRDVEHYLKLFTFLELDEIGSLVAAQQQDPASRPAQRRLAWVATALVHGEAEADKARARARRCSAADRAAIRTTRRSRSSRRAATFRSTRFRARSSATACCSWTGWSVSAWPHRRPTPDGACKAAGTTSTASR
jgi:tyrosyl-tRNA synthetase